MTDDRPFTKDDAATLSANLEKLFEAKLETLGERITGLRNWGVAVAGAVALLAGSTYTTHKPPAQQARTAIAVIRALL